MTNSLTAALLTAICAAGMVFGCSSNAKPDPKISPAVGTATKPSTPPIDPKMLLGLDELLPKVARPVNPDGWDKLPPRAEADVTAAEADIKKGDYVDAIKRLERARGFDQNNVRVRRQLGIAYAKLHSDGKALVHLRIAGKGAPDDLEVQVLLGRLAEAQRQKPQAVLAYRTALKCSQARDESPLVGEALWRLGQLLGGSKHYTAALECYSRLQLNISRHDKSYASRKTLEKIVFNPERLLSRRGELHLLLGKPDKAAKLLERSYRRHRTEVNNARLLMRALVAAKRFKQAETILGEIAVEPVLKPLATEMARTLCAAAKDKTLPARLWKAHRDQGQLDGELAVVLAQAAQKLQADSDATAILESVMETMPGNVPVGRFLARLHSRQGHPDKAIMLLCGLFNAEKAADRALLAGLREMAAGKPSLPLTFERDFAARVEAGKTSDRHVLLYAIGTLARIRGKADTATELLRKSLDAKADFLPAAGALATIYIEQRNHDGVEAMLASLKSAAGSEPLVHLIRGQLYLAKGLPKKTIEELENVLSRKSNLRTRLLLATAHSQIGRLNVASRILGPAMRDHAGNVELHKQLFRLYMNIKARAKNTELKQTYVRLAESVVRRLLNRRPDNHEALLMQAELQLAQKENDLASKTLKHLQTQMPGSPSVKLLAVRVELARTKTLTDAQQKALILRLREVMKAQPDNIEAATILAGLLEKTGKVAELMPLWRDLYKHSAGDVRVALPFVESLTRATQHARSAEVLENIVQNDPSNAGLRLKLVELLLKVGGNARAAEHGDKGLAALSHPRIAEAYREELLKLYREAKAFEQAHALLDDWILTTGRDEMILALKYDKVQLYAEAKQFDQAEKYATAWLKKSPQLIAPRAALMAALMQAKEFDRTQKILDAWLLKAAPGATTQATQPTRADKVTSFCLRAQVSLLFMQDKYATALKRLEPLIKAQPKNTGLLTLKSSCLSELNRDEEAFAPLEKALAIKPDDADINNNLGYMYADFGINLNQAGKMIRKALARRPDALSFMDSLAWVFYKQGRLAKAGRKFDQILAHKDLKDHDHPVIYDHAGDTYYRLGKKDKAVKMWKLALARAKKETRSTAEIRKLNHMTKKKLKAVTDGVAAPVAPLGKGVKEPATAPAAASQPAGNVNR